MVGGKYLTGRHGFESGILKGFIGGGRGIRGKDEVGGRERGQLWYVCVC